MTKTVSKSFGSPSYFSLYENLDTEHNVRENTMKTAAMTDINRGLAKHL